MMPTTEMLAIAGVAVDVLLIVLVGAVLHRLAKDPTRAWAERERNLAALHDGLRLLVSQAEGQARTLDADLTAHAERLRGLIDQAARVEGAPAGADRRTTGPERTRPGSLRAQVAELARSGLEPDEIARELDLPMAEVRLLVGLARSAQARAQAAHAGGQE